MQALAGLRRITWPLVEALVLRRSSQPAVCPPPDSILAEPLGLFVQYALAVGRYRNASAGSPRVDDVCEHATLGVLGRLGGDPATVLLVAQPDAGKPYKPKRMLTGEGARQHAVIQATRSSWYREATR